MSDKIVKTHAEIQDQLTMMDWLNSEPPAEEIMTNDDGSQYIPIGIIENLLTQYSNSKWSTTNFKWNFLQQATTLFISGSVEIVIHIFGFPRHLTGAATITDFAYAGNQDYIATVLSEATKNAAKKLGVRFGKNLNGRSEKRTNGLTEKKSVKLKPDAGIMKIYMDALGFGDIDKVTQLEKIYDIRK